MSIYNDLFKILRHSDTSSRGNCSHFMSQFLLQILDIYFQFMDKNEYCILNMHSIMYNGPSDVFCNIANVNKIT